MKTIVSHNVDATISDLALALSRLVDPTANPWVDSSFRKRLAQAETKLRTTYQAYTAARVDLRAASANRNLHGGSLIRTIRDFVSSVNRSALRKPENQVWVRHFQTHIPLPQAQMLDKDWLGKGQAIALAQTQLEQQPELAAITVPQPGTPSATEVADAYTLAKAADSVWRDAIAVLKQQANLLRDVRKDVSGLLSGLRHRLKEGFRNLPPEQRREQMRLFGVRFASERKPDDEAPDPSVPAPATNP